VLVHRERTDHNTIHGAPERDGARSFMFPDERFMRTVEDLGFNRNDGILSLMPLVCYVADE